MIELAILIVLSLLLIAILAAIHVQLRHRSIPQPEQQKKPSPTWDSTTRYNRRLYEVLYEIRNRFKADHICIARLHNGGYFNNEFPIRRFSVVMEAHNPDRTKSLVDRFRDTHISKYPEVMHQLIFMKDFICKDINYCEDNKFKCDVAALGFKSSYLFLIRQVNEQKTSEAFLWLNFTHNRELSKEEQTDLWAKHNSILNLLNMTREM